VAEVAVSLRPDRRTVNLFGVPTDALTIRQTVDAARALVRTGLPHQHVVLNAAKVVEMNRNPSLRQVVPAMDSWKANRPTRTLTAAKKPT